jgi:hypothetical protein
MSSFFIGSIASITRSAFPDVILEELGKDRRNNEN